MWFDILFMACAGIVLLGVALIFILHLFIDDDDDHDQR